LLLGVFLHPIQAITERPQRQLSVASPARFAARDQRQAIVALQRNSVGRNRKTTVRHVVRIVSKMDLLGFRQSHEYRTRTSPTATAIFCFPYTGAPHVGQELTTTKALSSSGLTELAVPPCGEKNFWHGNTPT